MKAREAPAAMLPPEGATGGAMLGRAAATPRDTVAEIAAWARAASLHSIQVVTAGHHMPRATLELRRALPEVTLPGHPVVSARPREAGATANPSNGWTRRRDLAARPAASPP